MSDVRSVTITGGAVTDYTGEGKKPRASSRKKKQEGGNVADNAGSTNPAQWLKAPITPVSPIIHVDMRQQLPAQQQQAQQQPQHGGSVKNIKVELKKKVVSRKVQLHPKKTDAPKKKPHTKKVRKITLGVSSMHRRMTLAKKVHKKIKEMPLDKLREHLVSRKLIKATSKAPESVLRQIAADSQLVAKKIL